MRHLKLSRQGFGYPTASEGWGTMTVFLEIDDQHAIRQVNVFESGHVLRYDRNHWCDDFGQMFIGLFSRKQKARGSDGEFIRADEFERQWQLATQSGIWQEQVARSKQTQWGTWSDRTSS